MSKVEFLRLMESLMSLPAGGLCGGEELAGLAAWDSLAVVEFLALADREIGVAISLPDLARCRTFDDLHGLLRPARAA